MSRSPVPSRPHRRPRHRRPAFAPLAPEAMEPRLLLATFLVNNNGDSGAGTLRQAILDANSTPGTNAINFALAASGVVTIAPLSPLPAITNPVIIDGYTEPGAAGNGQDQPDDDKASLTVHIDGSSAGAGATGLAIQAPNSQVSGLAIINFSGPGISISGAQSSGNFLYGNFLGTTSDPTVGRNFPSGLGNGAGTAPGLLITSSNNRIGGNTPGLRNVILGNGIGVQIAGPSGTGNLVQGNFILDNALQGVLITSSDNTIGEALAGGGNVISGNGSQGVEISGGPSAQGNLLLGNNIGTDIGADGGLVPFPIGLNPRPNAANGVLIENSPNNFVGGLGDAAKNVIAANLLDGIFIDGPLSTGNVVTSNWVGFNIVNNLEALSIPNHADGIHITSANNTIGGTTATAQNTFGLNALHGIELDGPGATGNLIEGNVVGLNPAAGSDFGNTFDGIHLDGAPNNTIGGTVSGAANVISGNNNGIVLINAGSTGNLVAGNLIGVAGDGLTQVANSVYGIEVVNAPRNTIGGTSAAASNVISANNWGVRIDGAAALGNLLEGNFLGTDRTATANIGNKVDGVWITGNASNNALGGVAPGAGNTIAYNVGDGIRIDSGINNSIVSNSIVSNRLLGIDLGGDGVTPNQPGGILGGPNNLLNYPVLVAVAPDATGTNIQGTFHAAARTDYVLQFFSSPTADPTGFGEGQTLVGSTTVTTDANGKATFHVELPAGVPSGQFVAATATDPTGDTSEFSNAMVSAPVSIALASAATTVNENAGTATITLTRTGGLGGQVAVNFATSDGTAKTGTNYTAVSGTVFFNAGQTTQTVTIPVLDDLLPDGNLTVNLALSAPQGGATIGLPGVATLTINNVDQPSLVFSASGYTVAENGGQATVTVTRNGTQGTSTVNYSTGGGTAVAGTDYTPVSGTLTFTPGQSSQSFNVPIIDNHQTGLNRTFTATLSTPTGGVLGAPTSATVTILTVRLTALSVVTLADSGPGSLRQAILDADASPGTYQINFNIPASALPASGIATIRPLSPLPAITNPVILDGYTQPGAASNGQDQADDDTANLTVQIDGTATGAGAAGLSIQAANCRVSGLAIINFSGPGMVISGAQASGNFVFGNFIGTTSDTSTGRNFPIGLGNGAGTAPGLLITSSNNRIGGDTPGLRNVILGNGIGIEIASPSGTGNLVQGNFILDNALQGVLIMSSDNTIGEAQATGGNVISGNGSQGVEITGGPAAQGNLIYGNNIGTDIGEDVGNVTVPIGLNPRPNGANGVLIENSPNNFVGGVGAATKNAIAANLLDGIFIDGPQSTGNVVASNWVGFNIANGLLTLTIPNRGDGLHITSANNTIGGTSANSQNTFSLNALHGIELDGPGATGNVIEGNLVGLNPGAGSDFGNTFDGIHLDGAPNNTIGGTIAGAANVISGNNNGIVLINAGTTGNLVAGNLIGVAGDGITQLGNSVYGVEVVNAPRNTIGGTTAAASNVISANNWGVRIDGAAALGNLLEGNFLGIDRTATANIGNKVDGVWITGNASNNTLGGAASGAGNTIAYNVGDGVRIDSGAGNSLVSNSIFTNTRLGIDLGGDGVTPNHLGAVLNGPNNLLNHPVLTAVAPDGAGTNVQGTFNAAARTTYVLQFFSSPTADPTGFGEGQTLVGSTPVTTDANGNAAFNVDLSIPVPSGNFVAATATDPAGDTSEFSNAMVSVPVSIALASAAIAVNEDAGTATITLVRTGGAGGQVAVNFATSDGTAKAGTNYTAVSGTVFFNPGQTTQTVSIPVLDDHLPDANFTVNLTLSAPQGGATIGAPGVGSLTINNVDLIGLSFTAPTYTVAENGGQAIVTVTRNGTQGTSTVNYSTGGGTAVAGTNDTPVSGTLTFAPGESSRSFIVPVFDDQQVTPDLTVGLTLSGPTGGILGPQASTTIIIQNVDRSGTLQFGGPVVRVNENAGAATVVVYRTGGTGGAVSVQYATSGGSAVPGVNYTPVSGTVSFPAGATTASFQVPVLDDGQVNGNTTVNVTLSNPAGGATIDAIGSTSLAIVETDGSTPTKLQAAAPGPIVPTGIDGPTVQNVEFQTSAGAVTAIVLTFNRPLDPARAQNLGNYGYFVLNAGADGLFGTGDDGNVPIQAAQYDPTTSRVTLIPSTPLAPNLLNQVVINGTASAALGTGLTDTSGNLLDGLANGAAGSPYVLRFAVGTALAYYDSSGRAVTLQLNNGGALALQINPVSGNPQQVLISGSVPGKSVLKGKVHRPTHVKGPTPLPSIHGAKGVKIKLKHSAFHVG